MDGASATQISLIANVMYFGFGVAALAALVFGIIKTGGGVRMLIVVAAAATLLARLSHYALSRLFIGIGDRFLIILVPQIVAGLLNLAAIICLVLAIVKAWDGRRGAPPNYPPGPPQAYPQQTMQPPTQNPYP